MRDLHTDARIHGSAQPAIENNIQRFISAHNDGADFLVLPDQLRQILRPLVVTVHIMQGAEMTQHIMSEHHHFLVLAAQIFVACQRHLTALLNEMLFRSILQFCLQSVP